MASDRDYMQMALDAAKKQSQRYGSGEGVPWPDPLVGCVVVTPNGRVESGYRGEDQAGDHAEYTVLEKKFRGTDIKGATVFTTLEPCTRRGPNKMPCADRLVEAGVSRVVIGYMDLDDRGRGYQKLVDSGVSVQLFDDDLAAEVRSLNFHFIESRKRSSSTRPWFAEVEAACHNRVRVIADLAEAPRMNRLGDFPFPTDLLPKYHRNCAVNDRESGGWLEHIAEYKGLRNFGTVLDYEEYDYIHWKTLRDCGRSPRAVYAGAVLVCPDDACLYVHKRGLEVATEPGKLHGFLGGFIVDYQNNADHTLRHACLREVFEECSAQPSLNEARVVIVENVEIGWVDVMYMAGVISRSNAEHLKGSKEGAVMAIPFNRLEYQLTSNRKSWVSNSIAHHLIWLRLGAPGAPRWFQAEAQDLYHRLIKCSYK